MNQYDPAPYQSPHPMDKPQKGWFGRNWMWFLPTVILLPILFCCGGGWWLVSFGMNELMNTPPYVDTLAELESNDEVVNAIGTPITSPEGFSDLIDLMENGGSFNIAQVNSQMEFDAKVPISGPNGRGTLIIAASSSDGGVTWDYSVREVQVDATGDVIDLLTPGATAPEEPDGDAEIPELPQTPGTSELLKDPATR